MKTIHATRFLALWLAALCCCISCSPGPSDTTEEEITDAIVPVQVDRIRIRPLTTYTELLAVSAYLQKSYVKANINGYVKAAYVQIGKQVQARDLLFNLITKEATSIGNAINQLDPAFQFSGVSPIRADQAGFITAVNHQQGDYVQDGEALAVIINQNSFVFLLEVPYELRGMVASNPSVALLLPDGEELRGTIGSSLPMVDSLAQTQRMVVHVAASHVIPEGLVAKVKVIRSASPNAQTLPRSAVLSNETEDEFWVMKLINDSTAIKVPIKRGLENDDAIEIAEPRFSPKDRIITTGNYGIADTARIQIIP